ncbi:MAG: NAD(P) transhydrogenase subunit alpha part 2, partial [Magnetovibrio sp.]|nr:NAD(P) transhydrogenase subunit alpha part 2 [Magnetovibrio sp.]
MDAATIQDQAQKFQDAAANLALQANEMATSVGQLAMHSSGSGTFSFMALFTIFVLACFIGY